MYENIRIGINCLPRRKWWYRFFRRCEYSISVPLRSAVLGDTLVFFLLSRCDWRFFAFYLLYIIFYFFCQRLSHFSYPIFRLVIITCRLCEKRKMREEVRELRIHYTVHYSFAFLRFSSSLIPVPRCWLRWVTMSTRKTFLRVFFFLHLYLLFGFQLESVGFFAQLHLS